MCGGGVGWVRWGKVAVKSDKKPNLLGLFIRLLILAATSFLCVALNAEPHYITYIPVWPSVLLTKTSHSSIFNLHCMARFSAKSIDLRVINLQR